MIERLLVLGSGFSGMELVRRGLERGLQVVASTRHAEQATSLRALGAEPLLSSELGADIAPYVDARTHVAVTFPPDGATDARVASWLASAGAITYISTTGVYGDLTGHIDDDTLVPKASEHTAPRLAAEQLYRERGGTVLRCPGIYGRERGLHRRVLKQQYALPGDGNAMSSRIHVYDLASFVLASPDAKGQTFVLGDLEPASQRTVVTWICATYGVPFPTSTAVESVHRTLRANRAIDSRRARAVLGVELRYPTFREGMAP